MRSSKDKSAILTDAGSGSGAAAAECFGPGGPRVAVADLAELRGVAVLAKIQGTRAQARGARDRRQGVDGDVRSGGLA